MLYEFLVPQYIKMLQNMNTIFDKAEEHAKNKKFDVEVLLTSRLAPDQFNFTRQIQILCDTAKFGAARLAGKEAPTHPDTETTLPQLRERVASVISYLESFTARDFAESSTRKISQPRWDGQYMTGMEFALEYSLPNLYFHMTTAYSILRHNGVDVGKKDYLGKLPYKR